MSSLAYLMIFGRMPSFLFWAQFAVWLLASLCFSTAVMLVSGMTPRRILKSTKNWWTTAWTRMKEGLEITTKESRRWKAFGPYLKTENPKPIEQQRERTAMVKPLVAFLFGGLIAAFAAMSIDRGREAAAYQAGRDSEIAARAGRTHTLYDLSVIRRHTDKKFTLEFKPFVVDLCPDGQPVDWQEGDSLRGWTFDQMADCKASKYFTTNTDRDSGERIKYARAGLP